ncbi:hypothetical protein HDU97_007806 [Phlyctochytrium planicorne]|nr:hypothetical protein HDU97_007806 [Phlyctochytrium planicorne]
MSAKARPTSAAPTSSSSPSKRTPKSSSSETQRPPSASTSASQSNSTKQPPLSVDGAAAQKTSRPNTAKSRSIAPKTTQESSDASYAKRKEGADVTRFHDQTWVDRVAKELKSQREWSDKWGCLNDPKLYLGEEGPDRFPKKVIPTAWSAFNIINPPGNKPTNSRPQTPESYDPPTFKITGCRDQYRNSNRVSLQSYNNISKHHNSNHSNNRPSYQPPSTAYATTTSSTNNTTITSRSISSSHGPKPDAAPSYSTSTSYSSSSSSEEWSFSSHPRRSVAYQTHHPTPTQYAFPPTTNRMYGWAWTNSENGGGSGRMNNLEIFGNTSANFSREAWRRAISMQD